MPLIILFGAFMASFAVPKAVIASTLIAEFVAGRKATKKMEVYEAGARLGVDLRDGAGDLIEMTIPSEMVPEASFVAGQYLLTEEEAFLLMAALEAAVENRPQFVGDRELIPNLKKLAERLKTASAARMADETLKSAM